MNQATIRNRLIHEINLLPEGKLTEVYDLLHYFRLGIGKAAKASQMKKVSVTKPKTISSFCGVWSNAEADSFDKNLAGLRLIDEDMWKS